MTLSLFMLFGVMGHIAHAAQNYAVTDLGTLGGTNSYGYRVNNSGQVVGQSYTANNLAFPLFLYSNGTMTALDTIGMSFGLGLNDAGQIAGFAKFDGNAAYHAALYSAGITTDLGTLGGASSEADGINASGVITGSSYLADNQTMHAFLYANGTMTDLGSLGGKYSAGTSINSSGQIAGYSTLADGSTHAIIYSNGVMHDIGTLGGGLARGYSINASGQVTGYSDFNGPGSAHAFLYSNGTMMDLGALGGYASTGNGINDNGVVVGDNYLPDQSSHPFVYSNSTMTDLNTLIPANSGWTLTSAEGINNSGQIVGYGKINGNTHAFLLTPIIFPGVITGMSAIAVSNSQINLHWNAASDATSYSIFRGPVSGQYHTYIGTSNTTNFSDLHLQSGTSYYYIVIGVNQFGQGPKSTEVGVATQAGVPGVVTNLTATSFSAAQINLHWNATDGATSYSIFRGPISGQYHTYIGTSNTTNFSDLHLQTGTPYYYIVIAVNSYGQGPKSPEVAGMTSQLPSKVTGITAIASNPTQINLQWTPTDGATSYSIFRGPISGQYHTYIGTSNTTSFSDLHLQPGTNYYYIVIAVNSYGQGPKSAEIAAITPAN